MGSASSKQKKKHNMAVKIKRIGGYVQEVHRPITAQEVMLRNPKHWVAKEGVFQSRNPIADVIPPETVLLQGQIFLLVPFQTMHSLLERRRLCPEALDSLMDRPGLAIRGWYHRQQKTAATTSIRKRSDINRSDGASVTSKADIKKNGACGISRAEIKKDGACVTSAIASTQKHTCNESGTVSLEAKAAMRPPVPLQSRAVIRPAGRVNLRGHGKSPTEEQSFSQKSVVLEACPDADNRRSSDMGSDLRNQKSVDMKANTQSIGLRAPIVGGTHISEGKENREVLATHKPDQPQKSLMLSSSTGRIQKKNKVRLGDLIYHACCKCCSASQDMRAPETVHELKDLAQ